MMFALLAVQGSGDTLEQSVPHPIFLPGLSAVNHCYILLLLCLFLNSGSYFLCK